MSREPWFWTRRMGFLRPHHSLGCVREKNPWDLSHSELPALCPPGRNRSSLQHKISLQSHAPHGICGMPRVGSYERRRAPSGGCLFLVAIAEKKEDRAWRYFSVALLRQSLASFSCL